MKKKVSILVAIIVVLIGGFIWLTNSGPWISLYYDYPGLGCQIKDATQIKELHMVMEQVKDMGEPVDREAYEIMYGGLSFRINGNCLCPIVICGAVPLGESSQEHVGRLVTIGFRTYLISDEVYDELLLDVIEEIQQDSWQTEIPIINQTDDETIAPTGYANGEIQWRYVMVEGRMYEDVQVYQNEYFEKLPEGYRMYGKTNVKLTTEYPTNDLEGTQLPVGTIFYYNPEQLQYIYQQEEDGYGLYEVVKMTEDIVPFSYEEDKAMYKENTPGVYIDGFQNNTSSTILNSQDALERAKLECTLSYNQTTIYYDADTSMWMVLFHTEGVIGDCQSVYLDEHGITQLIVYGE